jgi:signal transduction histidine kinase
VEIRFYANGVAIPAQDQERIFERFYKVDQARDRKTEGSGLGLSIVRKIIDIHRGTIELRLGDENEKCFLVRIPNLIAATSEAPE